MLKKMLPALCCAALAAGCASTATTGSSAEPLSGEKPAQLADRSFMWVDGAKADRGRQFTVLAGAVNPHEGTIRELSGFLA